MKKIDSSIDKDIKNALRRPLSPFISDFLDESEQALAENILKKTKREFRFDGGYEDALRKVLIIAPEDIPIEQIEVPISGIVFKKPPTELSHRNVLGSIMSLGISRDTVGDIAIWDDLIQVVVIDRLKEYLFNNFRFVNNNTIEPEILDYPSILPFKAKYSIETGTAASSRLDAVCAAVFKTSRKKVTEYIKKGQILLNHLPETKITTLVKDGDTISMRGEGKVKINEFSGLTKKKRLRFSYFKYI